MDGYPLVGQCVDRPRWPITDIRELMVPDEALGRTMAILGIY